LEHLDPLREVPSENLLRAVWTNICLLQKSVKALHA
jgi:hypothetical protein